MRGFSFIGVVFWGGGEIRLTGGVVWLLLRESFRLYCWSTASSVGGRVAYA